MAPEAFWHCSNMLSSHFYILAKQNVPSLPLCFPSIRPEINLFFFLRSPGFLECKTVFLHATLVASTWKIPKMEESGGLQSVGHKESDTTQRLNNNKIPATQLLPFQITSLWIFGVLCNLGFIHYSSLSKPDLEVSSLF